MTDYPEIGNIFDYLDEVLLIFDKREIRRYHESKSGMFQGWTGTADTLLHTHMLMYITYKARESNIISFRESAYMLTLIDDAVL